MGAQQALGIVGAAPGDGAQDAGRLVAGGGHVGGLGEIEPRSGCGDLRDGWVAGGDSGWGYGRGAVAGRADAAQRPGSQTAAPGAPTAPGAGVGGAGQRRTLGTAAPQLRAAIKRPWISATAAKSSLNTGLLTSSSAASPASSRASTARCSDGGAGRSGPAPPQARGWRLHRRRAPGRRSRPPPADGAGRTGMGGARRLGQRFKARRCRSWWSAKTARPTPPATGSPAPPAARPRPGADT